MRIGQSRKHLKLLPKFGFRKKGVALELDLAGHIMRALVDFDQYLDRVMVLVVAEIRRRLDIQITFLLIEKTDLFEVFFEIAFLKSPEQEPYFLFRFHEFAELFFLEGMRPLEGDLGDLKLFSLRNLDRDHGFLGLGVYVHRRLKIHKTEPLVRVELADLFLAFFDGLAVQDLPLDHSQRLAELVFLERGGSFDRDLLDDRFFLHFRDQLVSFGKLFHLQFHILKKSGRVKTFDILIDRLLFERESLFGLDLAQDGMGAYDTVSAHFYRHDFFLGRSFGLSGLHGRSGCSGLNGRLRNRSRGRGNRRGSFFIFGRNRGGRLCCRGRIGCRLLSRRFLSQTR